MSNCGETLAGTCPYIITARSHVQDFMLSEIMCHFKLTGLVRCGSYCIFTYDGTFTSAITHNFTVFALKLKEGRIMIESFHELIFLIETYPSHTTTQCICGEAQEIATIEGRKIFIV